MCGVVLESANQRSSRNKKGRGKKKKSFSASVLGKRVSDQGADDPRADKHIIGSYILVKNIR